MKEEESNEGGQKIESVSTVSTLTEEHRGYKIRKFLLIIKELPRVHKFFIVRGKTLSKLPISLSLP